MNSDIAIKLLRHTLFDRLFPPPSVSYSFFSQLQEYVNKVLSLCSESITCIAPVQPMCPINIFHVHLYEKLHEIESIGGKVILFFLTPTIKEYTNNPYINDIIEHEEIIRNTGLNPTCFSSSDFNSSFKNSIFEKAIRVHRYSHLENTASLPPILMAQSLHAALETNANLILFGEMEWHLFNAMCKIIEESNNFLLSIFGLYLPLLHWANPLLTAGSNLQEIKLYFKQALTRADSIGLRTSQDIILLDMYRYFFRRDLDEIDLIKMIRNDIPPNSPLEILINNLSDQWDQKICTKWNKKNFPSKSQNTLIPGNKHKVLLN